jgi:hypothetical protein
MLVFRQLSRIAPGGAEGRGMGKKQLTISLAIAFGALAAMMIASVAQATHARPKGATPIRVSVVPAYNACTAPNRTHGPPLAFPSCNPPVQSSTSLTVGTPDANGATANSTAFIKLDVKVGVVGPPDDSDVNITADSTDIRCKAGVTACGSANTADGPDYTGQLQGNATIRITDHYNAVAPGGGTDAATVVDIPFPVPATCAATADASIGARCSTNTSANATVPGSVLDAKRAIVEIGQITITDGGPDGQNGTTPNTLFGVQGIFIP